MEDSVKSQGIVEFAEFSAHSLGNLRFAMREPDMLERYIRDFARRRFSKKNLVFNFPREQYAKLDRGEAPSVISANYLTLTNEPLTNPATLVVPGEAIRVQASARIKDPTNPKSSIFRFLLEPGQFVGTFSTAALIGSDATADPGTGKIIAAVGNIKDDAGSSVSRDGTTIHLINWKLKHIDSSEV
jgi:hypothetical protein